MADLAAIVRTSAWDRYISTLFAPAEKRDALFALYAFDAEVARIALLVHDPLPGEIRLQWWRDVANGTRDAEAQGHPVATTLLQTIKDHNLPRSAFDTYCDARIFDFYHDAMPDQTALEAYLGATHSAFIQLACLIVDKDAARQAADASGHAGVALGTAAIIQQLPRTRSRSQCYVPADILNACGLDSDAFIKGDNKSAIKNAIDARHQVAGRRQGITTLAEIRIFADLQCPPHFGKGKTTCAAASLRCDRAFPIAQALWHHAGRA
jgi:15-cis-phytoene synthase